MSRRTAIPSMKCSATSKSTGVKCRGWALPGLTVCHRHGGGNPASQAKSDRLLTFAELYQANKNSPKQPWEWLNDTLSLAGSNYQRYTQKLDRGETLTPDEEARLHDARAVLFHMTNTALHTKSYERATQAMLRYEEKVAKLVAESCVAVLDALDSLLGWDPLDHNAIRVYALRVAQAHLAGTDLPARPVLSSSANSRALPAATSPPGPLDASDVESNAPRSGGDVEADEHARVYDAEVVSIHTGDHDWRR